MFWIINFGIGLLDILLMNLLAVRSKWTFRKRYPDLEIVKSHWSVTVTSIIKLIVMSMCPIMNLFMIWAFIFNDEELCEKTVASIYARCIKEQSNAT